jgi:hypothetical protein
VRAHWVAVPSGLHPLRPNVHPLRPNHVVLHRVRSRGGAEAMHSTLALDSLTALFRRMAERLDNGVGAAVGGHDDDDEQGEEEGEGGEEPVAGAVARCAARKQRKEQLLAAAALFNRRPKKGLAALAAAGFLPEDWQVR